MAVFSVRMVKAGGFQFRYIPLWILWAAFVGGGGFMEYYVQRRGNEAAFAYSVMSGCLIFVILLENITALIPGLPPVFQPTSQLFTVLKKGAVYALVAVSMNLLNGFTGLFSLGQAGFMLLGAYTFAILNVPMAAKDQVYYDMLVPGYYGGMWCYSDEYNGEVRINELREEYLEPGDIFIYLDLTEAEEDGEPFDEKVQRITGELSKLFNRSHELEDEIRKQLGSIGIEF